MEGSGRHMVAIDFDENTSAAALQSWLASRALRLSTTSPGEARATHGSTCPRCGSLIGERTVVATLEETTGTCERFYGQGDLITAIRLAIRQYAKARGMLDTVTPPAT